MHLIFTVFPFKPDRMMKIRRDISDTAENQRKAQHRSRHNQNTIAEKTGHPMIGQRHCTVNQKYKRGHCHRQHPCPAHRQKCKAKHRAGKTSCQPPQKKLCPPVLQLIPLAKPCPIGYRIEQNIDVCIGIHSRITHIVKRPEYKRRPLNQKKADQHTVYHAVKQRLPRLRCIISDIEAPEHYQKPQRPDCLVSGKHHADKHNTPYAKKRLSHMQHLLFNHKPVKQPDQNISVNAYIQNCRQPSALIGIIRFSP